MNPSFKFVFLFKIPLMIIMKCIMSTQCIKATLGDTQAEIHLNFEKSYLNSCIIEIVYRIESQTLVDRINPSLKNVKS